MTLTLDIETTGLNAMEDRIICISVLTEAMSFPLSFYGEDEKKILQQFWNCINRGETLIGYNIDNFDIPFLIKRSLINNIKIFEDFKTNKILDLRKLVNGFFYSYNKYEKGTLNQWAKILKMDEKLENGHEILLSYEKKDWKTIKNHCEYDVVITNKLYERCRECRLC